jgi:hypothetical protein
MTEDSGLEIAVSLNFAPSFYCKHLGVSYGEEFYFDPRYRAEVECRESQFLYEILGRYGVGDPHPLPSTGLFIQPIDLLKLTQGATLYCPSDATLESRGHPWAGLNAGQISRIDPRSAANHVFVDTLLEQYRTMLGMYGDKADLFGIKTGLMNLHAPFTTAHQLYGEDLFLMLLDDPDAARVVFRKIRDLYHAIFSRLALEMGAAIPTRLLLGDCSASLLSPGLYRDTVLPVNQELAKDFDSCGYHSCGPSTHLLTDFAHIPGLTSIELGAGTDLELAVRYLPRIAMRPLVDPVMMLDAASDTVREEVTALIEACAPAGSTTLCAWSFDRDTPVRNVEALYQTVREHQGGDC